MEEVKAAIKEIESGKAAGVNGVTVEMMKSEETETTATTICLIFGIVKRRLKHGRLD